LGGDKHLPKVKGGSLGKVWVKVFEMTVCDDLRIAYM